MLNLFDACVLLHKKNSKTRDFSIEISPKFVFDE